MKQALGFTRWGRIGLSCMVATIALSRPAAADDLAVLVYPVYIWPVGGLLLLVLLTLIILTWRAKRPAKRLGLVTAVVAALAGLAFPPFVFILGISRFQDINLMTVLPVECLALAGVVMGIKARRSSVSGV